MNQKGFAPMLFLIGIIVITLVVGGGIFWVQKINRKPSIDGPVLHLKQISDTDKIISPTSNTDQNQDVIKNEATPEAVLLAEQDFAKISGLNKSQIVYDKLEKVEWSDNSLGCPKEGNVYAQVITPGYRVIFSYNLQQVVYHTDLGRKFIMCQPAEGKSCGGFAGETGPMACPIGYYCKYPVPMYPDASGKCTKK